MKKLRRLLFASVLFVACGSAAAWDLAGTKQLVLHGKDGSQAEIGTVTFSAAADGTHFKLDMDHRQLKDYFLSMREFKCREGESELLCHVPYPYRNPGTVSRDNLAWLEHALLFFFKSPRDFGAKLWNGIYYKLELTEQGLVGTPQAVDLNLIGAPPADLNVPPYGPTERSEMPPGVRWFDRLTIR